jgi:hypothetical protein
MVFKMQSENNLDWWNWKPTRFRISSWAVSITNQSWESSPALPLSIPSLLPGERDYSDLPGYEGTGLPRIQITF